MLSRVVRVAAVRCAGGPLRQLSTAALFASLVLARAAQAEPTASVSPSSGADTEAEALPGLAHEKALATFKEGISAFDRRDFEAARVAFLQTLALKPSAAVVRRNLGLAEIYSGHYLDGARRLARVIHTTGEGTPQDRARMLESLKKAEAHLERVTVEVNVEGAMITLGGDELGVSPLPFAWYLPPGSYDVRVSKAGFAPFSATRLATAGSTEHLRISLKTEAPMAESSPRSSAPRVDMVTPPRLNPWVLAAGGVLSAGGLVAGLTFSLLASENADKVDRIGDALMSASVGCGTPPSQPCSQLSNAADAHDRQVLWATVSFATAGVAAVSTLLYALLGASGDDEPEYSPGASAGAASEPTLLGLSVDEDGGRLWFHTQF